MKDTGFSVPADKLDRLADLLLDRLETGEFKRLRRPRGGRFATPPAFESGGGGLVSTADDLLAFAG